MKPHPLTLNPIAQAVAGVHGFCKPLGLWPCWNVVVEAVAPMKIFPNSLDMAPRDFARQRDRVIRGWATYTVQLAPSAFATFHRGRTVH